MGTPSCLHRGDWLPDGCALADERVRCSLWFRVGGSGIGFRTPSLSGTGVSGFRPRGRRAFPAWWQLVPLPPGGAGLPREVLSTPSV